jgi:hypothetical protein
MNGDSAHSAAARPRMAAPNSALPAEPPADADVPKSVRLHRLDRVNVAQSMTISDVATIHERCRKPRSPQDRLGLLKRARETVPLAWDQDGVRLGRHALALR